LGVYSITVTQWQKQNQIILDGILHPDVFIACIGSTRHVYDFSSIDGMVFLRRFIFWFFNRA